MSLADNLSVRVEAGARAWAEQGNPMQPPPKSRYDEAAAELREALSDGRWHSLEVAKRIARKHRHYPNPLMDYAGVAVSENGKRIIWAFGAKEIDEERA